MSKVRSAIAHYNSLLESRRDSLPEVFKRLNERQLERKVCYEGRAIPSLLRPYFIDSEHVPMIQYSAEVLTRCLEKFIDAYAADEEVRSRIPFPEGWNDLLLMPGGLKRNIPVARFDGFHLHGSLRYTEFNADSPAAVAWNQRQQEVYLELELLQAFQERFEIYQNKPTDNFFELVVQSCKDFGLSDPPRMIITDWDEVSTRPEFELIAEYFEERGIPATIADPRAVGFKNGWLRAGDFKANLVVRRVILGELVERRKECRGLIEAAASGKVCFVNPFRTKIAGTKGAFAFLTDPRHAHLFTVEEREAIARHIPWTAVLHHQPISFQGRAEDPFRVAENNKDGMVVKPMNRYGGKGVVMGNETTDQEWAAVLARAEDEGGYCVQERVAIPLEDFPVVAPDLHFEPRMVNINPFCIGGAYAGSLVRVSMRSIINVSGGGAQIPSFVLVGEK